MAASKVLETDDISADMKNHDLAFISYIPHENGEVFVFFQKHEYKAYHGLMAINHDHQ